MFDSTFLTFNIFKHCMAFTCTQLTCKQTLSTTRQTLLTSQILITTLSSLPSKATDLPQELHSIIDLVTAQLHGHIPFSDREILSGDIDSFLSNISSIANALSVQLSVVTEYLCKIADPVRPPAISELNTRANSLQDQAMRKLPQDLQDAHLHLINSASALLLTHSSLLSASIRILEQTQHGALSRHTKSSAEFLHTKATLLGLQARIHMLSHPPPAEFVTALKEFKKSQGSGERSLKDRESLAKSELRAYTAAGEKGMKDLAKRKAYLVEEVGRTQQEVGKLERGN
jgi:hypothetical protein